MPVKPCCWTNVAANGWWYQSVSACVIPLLIAYATCVDHCTTTRATPTTVTATSPLGRLVRTDRTNSSCGCAPVAGRRRPATHSARPPSNSPTNTVIELNRCAAPSACATAKKTNSPMMISASRASAPDHCGSSERRASKEPYASAPTTATHAVVPVTNRPSESISGFSSRVQRRSRRSPRPPDTHGA